MHAKWKHVERPASRQRGIDEIGRDFPLGILETTSQWIVECSASPHRRVVKKIVRGVRNGGHAANAEAPPRDRRMSFDLSKKFSLVHRITNRAPQAIARPSVM